MTLHTALIVAALAAFALVQGWAMTTDTWDRAEAKFLSWAAERPAIGYPIFVALTAIIVAGVAMCGWIFFDTGRNIATIFGFI